MIFLDSALGLAGVTFQNQSNLKTKTTLGVDPTKLFFFANEEYFRFLLVSLRSCYIQKKILIEK